MKLQLLPVILFSLFQIAKSQTVEPGGVTGVVGWSAAMRTPAGQTGWHDLLHPGSPVQNWNSGQWLNFNATLHLLAGGPDLNIPLGENDLITATIFTVYQPDDTIGEKSIWTYTHDLIPSLALTSRSMWDADQDTLIDAQIVRKEFPIINTYYQNKKISFDASPTQNAFWLGRRPVNTRHAFMDFSGKVAELILFNRVLTGEEKQRVESYLALKYGIPLSQQFEPSSYVNSKGDVLWDAQKRSNFAHNMAGFGRDDGSGLNQKQSGCTYTPGLLNIGAGRIVAFNDQNLTILPENSFWIWSDNGMDLEKAKAVSGQPFHLRRQWIMSVHGQVSGIPTELQFNAKLGECQPADSETWWLSIDGSGMGKFPVHNTTYHKADSISTQGKVFFREVKWDTDDSGTDLFTFSIGPKMMGKMSISEPECASGTLGLLQIGAEGGRPPYDFLLSGHHFTRRWQSPDPSVSDISGIAGGEYQLEIRDADNTLYRSNFFVQSKDAPVSTLADRYELKKDETLELNAGSGLSGPIQYHWLGPANFYSIAPAVQITQPGKYILTLDREGCVSRKEIEVVQFEPDNFRQLSLSPNPVSTGGSFTVVIQLYRSGPVEAALITPLGVILKEWRFDGNDFYRWTETTPNTPGTYLLTFKSEESVQALKLIVH